MDNNILACEYGIEQLAELSRTDYRLDLNQGMDAMRAGSAVTGIPVETTESGDGGGYSTGVGTSANIVVDGGIYNEALGKMEQTDAIMEERLQHVITQVEEMCDKVFIMPETTAKVRAALDAVKGKMAVYSETTKQTAQITQRYIAQMSEIDSAL